MLSRLSLTFFLLFFSNKVLGAQGQGGMPQLNPASFSSQIFWLLISFSILFLIVHFFLLPRLKKIREHRDETINNYLSETLELLDEYMNNMHVRDEDRGKVSKLVESSKITRDREKKDPSSAGRALKDFVLWGKQSPYLRRSTLKEVESMTPEFLIEQAKQAMKYEADILYTGKLSKDMVKSEIKNNHVYSFRRGIYASKNLPKGHIIRKSDLITLRPAKGICAKDYYKLLGLKLIRPVKKNHHLEPDFFE